MYMDLQEEMVASTLRNHFQKADCAKELCCFGHAEEHVRCQGLTSLIGRSPFSNKLQGDLPSNYTTGLVSICSVRSPILEAIRKSAPSEKDQGMLLVRCRQCGDMINGDMESIEEHSVTCLAVKCRHCGQRMNADVHAIEAHSRVCLPIVEPLSVMRCQQKQTLFEDAPFAHSRRFESVPLSLTPGSDSHAIGSALLDVSAANLAHLSQHASQGIARAPFLGTENAFCTREELLRFEVRRQIEELSNMQQPLASSHRPLQIVVDNCATVSASLTQNDDRQEHCIVPVEQVNTWWRDFLASPANRIALLTIANLSLVFARDYLSHRARMSELQYRMDANLFLRFQHILANQLQHFLK